MDETTDLVGPPFTLRVNAPATLRVEAGDHRVLLTIHPDGSVEAPSLEAASEAGRVFVDSVREYLAHILRAVSNG